jgi:hypothetical protein
MNIFLKMNICVTSSVDNDQTRFANMKSKVHCGSVLSEIRAASDSGPNKDGVVVHLYCVALCLCSILQAAIKAGLPEIPMSAHAESLQSDDHLQPDGRSGNFINPMCGSGPLPSRAMSS